MKNTKWVIAGVVVLALIALALFRSIKSREVGGEPGTLSTSTSSIRNTKTATLPKGSGTPTIRSTLINTVPTPTGLPEIEFIDKELSFTMPAYDRINVRVTKVAFGRGDAVTS